MYVDIAYVDTIKRLKNACMISKNQQLLSGSPSYDADENTTSPKFLRNVMLTKYAYTDLPCIHRKYPTQHQSASKHNLALVAIFYVVPAWSVNSP